MIGYFEGINSERGIAWRLADLLALGRFVGIGLDEQTPDHRKIFANEGLELAAARERKIEVRVATRI